MTFRRVLALAAFVGPLASASLGYADPPCVADIKKLCADAKGAGATQACLKSHEADLSAGCKDHVANLRRVAGNVAAVCVWDIERFCPDVSPGGGRIIDCLKENRGDLSPECKNLFGAPENKS
jgi:hypothetical protein